MWVREGRRGERAHCSRDKDIYMYAIIGERE